MSSPTWDERYATTDLPWDTGAPDPHLVEAVERGVLVPGRMLEVGCGTGTNAIWLAKRGFEVHALDISPRAIEQAKAKAAEAGVSVQLATLDFLVEGPSAGPFDAVFDRGVFHVFDEAEVRARFARRVADSLAIEGQWLSLAGSTEGPPRDHGPPRRSALDLVLAVEPVLELLELRSTEFHANIPTPAKSWLLRARRRAIAPQPSTLR